VVSDFSGEAYGAEGQESKWVCFEELIALDFPDANQIIIEKLLENRR
jgi:8-oxo-dGTP diphosphatase